MTPRKPIPDAAKMAEKLAKIAQLLRRRGEPDAIHTALRSIHTNPVQTHGWKVLGHMLAQDGRWSSARGVYETAIAIDPSESVAARVGLATALAQQGLAGEAADLLAAARASATPSIAASLDGAYERLCRQLMPAHRYAHLQHQERRALWEQAIARACRGSVVFDISTNVLPMLLASKVCTLPVLRVDSFPRRCSEELLTDNSLSSPADVVLLPAADEVEQERLASMHAPAHSQPQGNVQVEQKRLAALHTPGYTQPQDVVLLADFDNADLMGSKYLSNVRSARKRLLAPGARVMPCTVEVHAALVQSEALAQLNSVTGPVAGLDLGELNRFRQRSRVVRLADMDHALLTEPQTVLTLHLDGDGLPKTSGEEDAELVVVQGGVAHAVVMWHTLVLAKAGHRVTTAPDTANTAARQVAYYLHHDERTCHVFEGQPLHLTFKWEPHLLELSVRAEADLGAPQDAKASPQAMAVKTPMQNQVGEPVAPKGFSSRAGMPKAPPPRKERPPTPEGQRSYTLRDRERFNFVIGTSLPPPSRVGEQNAGRGGESAPLFDYHFPMINDRGRNDAFAAAITKAVVRYQPSLVLDIGCGSGNADPPRLASLYLSPLRPAQPCTT